MDKDGDKGGCCLAGCFGSIFSCCSSEVKNDYQELDGKRGSSSRRKAAKAAESRRQQQERRGVPRDPNSRNTARRVTQEKPPEEIEMETLAPTECWKSDVGGGDNRSLNRSQGSSASATSSNTSAKTSGNQGKGNQKKGYKERHRENAVIQQKRNREEKIEKREKELAKMGGPSLKWQT